MELPPKPAEYVNNLEFMRNLTPYVFSASLIPKGNLLDVGCGVGYGTWLLATTGAVQIIASDLNERNVWQVSRLCREFKNVNNLVMDAQRLGFKNRSYDLVTCFEVIEHVPNPDMLLFELRRVLKNTGLLLITSPNRTVRLGPLQRPWNPEHLREYTVRALQRKLEKWFPIYKLLGIYGVPGPHEFYRRLWQPSFFNAYLSWTIPLLRVMIPTPIRRWIRTHLDHNNSGRSLIPDTDLSNMAIPSPDPKSWPFYVSDVNKDCLNLLAICGFDNQIVQKTASEIKLSAYRFSH